mmetsp:Transcript_15460/g.23343  ORF Transcript_15460/g.23343 Transcript_15460/m.23343 type:complete len:297 (-) Transcript_15460:81-971(-)|eukprot:CAMPEP_0185033820 /NCGR_PEP_ID=MMETSP1103-20130426/23173_1 /TAXON_ID=36769 /ORGANISM="Paraphysomonas bandaiensis, Strain Caron Lab Isolate" /LENGTH=296 /DNA_ID=CAMNT_0027570235 /DNA_START=61 /DNA_END=951 /DNA_ORIENTATION=-
MQGSYDTRDEITGPTEGLRGPIEELRGLIGEEISGYMSDHDCYRFLIARGMSMTKTVAMVRGWWQWWNSPAYKDGPFPSAIISAASIEDPNEEIYTDLCPHALHGFDKSGHPIYWEKTGVISHNLKHLKTQVDIDTLVARHIRIQTLTEMRQKYSSNKLGHPVEMAVIVFDLANVKKMPDLFGINQLRKIAAMDQNYYPERLATLIVINAPSFATSLYKLVSSAIDPKTASKIKIVGTDYVETLREHMDDSQIPEEYGGSAKNVSWGWPYSEESGVSPAQLRTYFERKTSSSEIAV